MKVKPILTSYVTFILWFLYDSLWRRKCGTFTTIAAGIMGVVFQFSVFGLVVIYARHFSSGERINLAEYAIDPRTSMELLVGGSLAVAILLLLSASCIYYSRRTILCMGREHEEFCAKRVLWILATHGVMVSATQDGYGGDSYLLRLVKTDSRLAGRVLKLLLSLIIPSVTLTISIIALFYLDSLLTFIIVALGTVLFFYQYRVSRLAAQHSMRFEKLGSATGAEYRALIQHSKHRAQAGTGTELIERLFRHGPVKKQLDAYEGRLRTVEKSRLVSGLFMGIVVGLIILIMGRSIIQEGAGWERLLVYVVALRFAMVNLQNVFSTITAINRFYPQLRRYYLFVRSFDEKEGVYEPLQNEYILKLDPNAETEHIEDTQQQFKIRQGTRLALVTPTELHRFTLAGLINNLFRHNMQTSLSVINASRYAGIKHSCSQSSLREALGLSSHATWSDLRVYFPDEHYWKRARQQLPSNLDKRVSSKQWEKTEPKLKFTLGLISARNGKAGWIFMQAKGLQLLGPEAALFYLTMFNDSIIVIVYNNDFIDVGLAGEQTVAVSDGKRLLGLGSPEWFENVRDVPEVIGISTTKKSKRGREQAVVNFEEDDES